MWQQVLNIARLRGAFFASRELRRHCKIVRHPNLYHECESGLTNWQVSKYQNSWQIYPFIPIPITHTRICIISPPTALRQIHIFDKSVCLLADADNKYMHKHSPNRLYPQCDTYRYTYVLWIKYIWNIWNINGALATCIYFRLNNLLKVFFQKWCWKRTYHVLDWNIVVTHTLISMLI